ncbi:hypothetical protein [Brevundimonas sp. Root1423]|uniref:hypothetical protein n=1 Tax=Brevundimonas sp. Root1423 TaxID=1736462 RepID=UPI0006FB7C6F|nr:hypothetical protein [Brevundimonas sp. Root1423]KQY85026.1 hypothetical protein ASD25_08530 [Brevundimonas sp. Root1423]
MRNSTSRQAAGAAALALLLASGADALAQAQDPYAPRPQAAPAPSRDLSRVTPLLTVEDGTPRYQLVPAGSLSRSDAMNSQMLAFSLQDFLPVGAGRSSPVTTGEHGGEFAVEWHYVVRFWEEWPNAKDRPGHVERLGETDFEIRQNTPLTPPPAVKRVLDAQAERLRDAVKAHPFIQRSADVMTRVRIEYHRDRDRSGTEVWGFKLTFGLGPETMRPEQLPGGRWRWTSYDWMSLDICSNCFAELSAPTGRYRGLQTMTHVALVDSLAAPLWVSEYRSGEGPLIPNPELYDAARPTDIQILTVEAPLWIGAAAAVGPDDHHARAIAAVWLTDWKTLVTQANGPSAPRAD